MTRWWVDTNKCSYATIYPREGPIIVLTVLKTNGYVKETQTQHTSRFHQKQIFFSFISKTLIKRACLLTGLSFYLKCQLKPLLILQERSSSIWQPSLVWQQLVSLYWSTQEILKQIATLLLRLWTAISFLQPMETMLSFVIWNLFPFHLKLVSVWMGNFINRHSEEF